MTMIPAFGPWTEHPADTDEEKRLASAQQSKTSPLSVDKGWRGAVSVGAGGGLLAAVRSGRVCRLCSLWAAGSSVRRWRCCWCRSASGWRCGWVG